MYIHSNYKFNVITKGQTDYVVFSTESNLVIVSITIALLFCKSLLPSHTPDTVF